MPCLDCNSTTPLALSTQYFHNEDCFPCSNSSSGCDCTYTGSTLPCSGIVSGDSLTTILEKLDPILCSAAGDYSSYQYNCITPVNTEAEFVDSITDYVCTLNSTLTTFTGTTFPAYQSTVNSRFGALEVPAITCATASVTNTDTLQTVLNKYCTKLTSLTSAISLSGITWNNCYTVVSTPTTIANAFTEVLSQICQTKALVSSSLPTFNNTSNCLAGGATDSLVTTIGLITSQLCSTATYNGSVTSDCLTLPGTLEGDIQEIVDKIDELSKEKLTFSGDFVVTATNVSNPCAGKTLSLATPINQDRLVASNNSDTSPGTLINKLLAGTNVSLDDITTPGKVIINSSGDDHKVLADSTDDTPNYLFNKLEGSTVNGITITPVYNSLTKKVKLTLSVDPVAFCAAVSACVPSICISYTINNPMGAAVDVQYIPCGSTTPIVISVGASSSTTVCAVQYTVTPAVDGLTVTAGSSCSAP